MVTMTLACTSPDPSRAPWIHACRSSAQQRLSHRSLPCQGGQFEVSAEVRVMWRHRGLLQVCIVTPGAAHFTRARMAELEAAGEDPGLSVSGSTTRVCYSSHPSLAEVEAPYCTVLYCTVLYCRWRPWCATSAPTS